MDKVDQFDSCGIEVSAQELVVALCRDGREERLRSFPNTAEGHAAIQRFLSSGSQRVRVVLESTGLYGLDLAYALHRAAAVQVMVANPRAVRHFASALMKRSKNDRLDAVVLRQFAARMPFQPWTAPSPAAFHLCALARRLETLTEQCTAEKNRQHAASLSVAMPAAVRRDLQRSVRSIQRAIARLTQTALGLLQHDPLLNASYHLLLTAKGIGPTSALRLLAETALLSDDLDVRQWVAYAGLDPRQYQSGTSVHRKARISKTGNRHLRRALYMPALVAARREPHLRAFYQHLLGRGKCKMQALVAVMRKLLHAVYGMLKHRQPFDGAKLYRLTEPITAPTLQPCGQEAA
jgi:transposase